MLLFMSIPGFSQNCTGDLYIEIAGINPVSGAWNDCTGDEPWFNSEYIKNRNGKQYYSIFDLVKGKPYHKGQDLNGAQTFWFQFGEVDKNIVLTTITVRMLVTVI